MKWSVADFMNGVAKPATLPSVVLIYGEDGGVVRQRVKDLAAAVCADLSDPFLSDRVSAEELAKEPSRLLECASTLSFMTSQKLVLLEGLNGSVSKDMQTSVSEAVKMCLEAPLQGVVVLVGAEEIDDGGMMKAVLDSPHAAALRCYHDSAQDLEGRMGRFFKERGLTVDRAALVFLKENLGNDLAVTMGELEKLALYAGSKGSVSVEDCMEVVTSAPSVSVFKLCDALGQRDRKQVDVLLQALKEDGEDAVMVSALALRHFRRLLQARELMEQGLRVDDALRRLAPPVIYGKDVFAAQVRQYPLPRLREIVRQFHAAQTESRRGVLSAELVYERALLRMGS